VGPLRRRGSEDPEISTAASPRPVRAHDIETSLLDGVNSRATSSEERAGFDSPATSQTRRFNTHKVAIIPLAVMCGTNPFTVQRRNVILTLPHKIARSSSSTTWDGHGEDASILNIAPHLGVVVQEG